MGVVAVGQITLFDQNDSPVASLSNYAHPVPSASDGTSPNLAGAVSTFQILLAGVDITNLYSVTAAPSSGITGSLSTYTYSVSGMTVDAGYVDFTAARPGFATLTKRFSLAKQKQGVIGPQGVDSPACLGLFNYADRDTITGMVAGSLVVLYSATVSERGIYSYLTSAWTRQTSPMPDQVSRCFLYVIDAVRQGFGSSTDYIGSSAAFEIIMVKFLYLLWMRLETSGGIYSGGYDQEGNVAQDSDGIDLPGAFISGNGAFAGVGAVFKSLFANVLTTLVKYSGEWVLNSTWGSETGSSSFDLQRVVKKVNLPDGRVIAIYNRSSDLYLCQRIRTVAGAWGSETVIASLAVYDYGYSAAILPDGRVICVYTKASNYYLYQTIRATDGTWGTATALESTAIDSPVVAAFSDGRAICVYTRDSTNYMYEKVRSAEGVWGSATAIISNPNASYPKDMVVLADESVLLVYQNPSSNFCERVRPIAGGAWGAEAVILTSCPPDTSLAMLPDDRIICSYTRYADNYLCQKIRPAASSSWGAEAVIHGAAVDGSAITVLQDGHVFVIYKKNSAAYLYWRSDASAVSAVPLGLFETAVGSGVIECGQNSSGYYIKLGDGTMICWKAATFSTTIALATGSIYYCAAMSMGNWPVYFTATPAGGIFLINRGSTFSWPVSNTGMTTSAAGTVALASSASRTSDTYTFAAVAIGRWK